MSKIALNSETQVKLCGHDSNNSHSQDFHRISFFFFEMRVTKITNLDNIPKITIGGKSPEMRNAFYNR